MQKELIHEVEMGPFKHPVDDGLDLRKVSYICMYFLCIIVDLVGCIRMYVHTDGDLFRSARHI